MPQLTNFQQMTLIGGLILIGTLFMYSLSAIWSGKTDADMQSDDIVSIITGYQMSYASSGYPVGALDPTQLIAGNYIDQKIVSGGALVTRTTGSTISAAAAGTSFTLTVPGLPQDQCITALQRGNMGGKVLSVSVDGGSAANLPLTTTTSPATLCNIVGTTNSLVYTAHR